MRYLFIQPFSCVSPVSCWHWDDVNTIRWSLFFAKDNKQTTATAIASNFWMKKLCNVKPKIKIQDYETTTIIMLSNMRIKFNKKTTMGNLAPSLQLNRYFFLHSQGVGGWFLWLSNSQRSNMQKKHFHHFFQEKCTEQTCLHVMLMSYVITNFFCRCIST